MLTDEGDLVFDPFAGTAARPVKSLNASGVDGSVESWMSSSYAARSAAVTGTPKERKAINTYYQIPRPGILWDDSDIHVPATR